MKLMPASNARWTIATQSSWSGLPQPPNIIAPSQSSLTWTPVRPSVRYFIVGSSAGDRAGPYLAISVRAGLGAPRRHRLGSPVERNDMEDTMDDGTDGRTQHESDVPPIADWNRLLDGKVAVVTGGGDGIGG